jgi:aspartyl-tRNA synthetase
MSELGSEGLLRTHHCGELNEEHVGQEAVLCGWVNKYRDLGGLHFIDVRDKYGLTQLSFENFTGDLEVLKRCNLESTIRAKGKIEFRPESAQNKKMKTGQVELQVTEIEVLSESDKDNIPFLPFGSTEPTEDLALKYRYLDLRRERLQGILKKRSDATLKIRQALMEEEFIEIETPILYKSTPEGARDYIVPSRVHPGKVYALPQSPQTLKQLLMIGGTDRYFQICRCFRDEDLRADRQPEFSQIDIEVSYASADYIKRVAEKLMKRIFDLPENFILPAMSYAEAMTRFGSDKPDIRFGLEHMIVTDLFKETDFAVFNKPATQDGMIKAIFVPLELGTFSRKDTDALTEIVKPYGGKGVAFFKVNGKERSAGISKFITDEVYQELIKLPHTDQDGTWLFCADLDSEVVHASADALRRHLGKKLEIIKEGHHFLWVYDWPLLEWDGDNNRFIAKHHPFTSPKVEEKETFLKGKKEDLAGMLAEAYDVVCNGYELGGGSVRIHEPEIQAQMFKSLGMSEEEVKHQFGFFIESLKYGVPPHAGIAFGLDRIIMILVGTDSIRDVIAFPKTTSATDLMANAPSSPGDDQLKELKMEFSKK